jgi:hypothetical protein
MGPLPLTFYPHELDILYVLRFKHGLHNTLKWAYPVSGFVCFLNHFIFLAYIVFIALNNLVLATGPLFNLNYTGK